MSAEADDLTPFEFFGETFHLRPGNEYQPEMMEFANVANGGGDSNMLSGATAVFTFLKAIVHPGDWDAFWASAKKNHATVDDHFMPIVVAAFTQEVERPTGRSSDSSDGPKNTRQKSAGESSSAKVIRREEKKGRPDRALMLVMADEARSARSA